MNHPLNNTELEQRITRRFDNRFDSMEKKFDKMSEAMIALARNEERVAVVIEDNAELKQIVHKLTKKVSILEMKATNTKGVVSMLERAFWIGFTIAASALTSYLAGKE